MVPVPPMVAITDDDTVGDPAALASILNVLPGVNGVAVEVNAKLPVITVAPVA